jgi:hypothetical protein
MRKSFFKPLQVEVVRQGKPVVDADASHVLAACRDLVAVEIDLKSKWCEVNAVSGDEVWIGTTERSINLKEDSEEDLTCIRFPEFDQKIWAFFSQELSRYTLRVVFVRRSAAGLT